MVRLWLGAFEQPEGTPCWHKAREPLSCGDTASRFFKYLSPNQSGAEKPANIICCRWISDGSCTASWVWHGLIPLVFAGYLPSQQPDICGVNHFQLFHRRTLSSSINNNSSQTGVSVFAWGSGALLLPFRPLHPAHLLLEKDRRSLLQASHRQQKEVPAIFSKFLSLSVHGA